MKQVLLLRNACYHYQKVFDFEKKYLHKDVFFLDFKELPEINVLHVQIIYIWRRIFVWSIISLTDLKL
jgi:hypothetical protein